MSSSLRKKMNLRKIWHHPLDPDISRYLPMRIKSVTALAYFNQFKRQKDNPQVALEHFFMERKMEHYIKTGCKSKKVSFF